MTAEKIASYIDHTLLKPFCTKEQIIKLCEEAIQYKTASVCIPSCYVKLAKDRYKDKLTICTVVGFPLGYANTEGKAEETRQAIADGADEVDMVINLTWVKNKEYQKVEDEIALLKSICKDKVLKVIIETCYLTEEEKIAMCKAVSNAKADYIKTSTGFGDAGATLEDIKLMKENIAQEVKIKAAGGIRTKEAMEQYIEAGCDRIGCSSTAVLFE